MDFDVVRTSVSNAYQHYKSAERGKFNQNMATYYTAGKENPSVSHMIMADVLKKEGERQIENNLKNLSIIEDNLKLDTELLVPFADKTPVVERSARRNLAFWDTALGTQKLMTASTTKMEDEISDEVKVLKDSFDKSYKEKYPKTHHIRKRLIDDYGFSMERTAPKRTFEQKIQLAAPENGYKSIYPNTYETRVRLLSANRLGKSGKVSWMKKKLWNNPIVRGTDLTKAILRFF